MKIYVFTDSNEKVRQIVYDTSILDEDRKKAGHAVDDSGLPADYLDPPEGKSAILYYNPEDGFSVQLQDVNTELSQIQQQLQQIQAQLDQLTGS